MKRFECTGIGAMKESKTGDWIAYEGKDHREVPLQLLAETGINPFAVKLLVESFKKINPEVKKVIPNPFNFIFDGVKIAIQEVNNE